MTRWTLHLPREHPKWGKNKRYDSCLPTKTCKAISTPTPFFATNWIKIRCWSISIYPYIVLLQNSFSFIIAYMLALPSCKPAQWFPPVISNVKVIPRPKKKVSQLYQTLNYHPHKTIAHVQSKPPPPFVKNIIAFPVPNAYIWQLPLVQTATTHLKKSKHSSVCPHIMVKLLDHSTMQGPMRKHPNTLFLAEMHHITPYTLLLPNSSSFNLF